MPGYKHACMHTYSYMPDTDIHVVFLALVKVTLVDAYIHLYCCYINLYWSVLFQVCLSIYTVIVYSSGLYTCLLAIPIHYIRFTSSYMPDTNSMLIISSF